MQRIGPFIRARWPNQKRRELRKESETHFDTRNSRQIAKAAGADPAKWILVLLPVVLLFAHRGWIYTTPATIDAWVYFGYFEHLVEYKATLFPNLYYGTRLPWILPGYIAYHLFRPEIANYVLHLAFYYAATFSVYSLLKRAAGFRNALLGAVLFGTCASFLAAVGWDYVDGAGATYFLIALAWMARASDSGSRVWLVVAGMAALAMCYTNMFLLMFLPFVPALYLFVRVKGFDRTLLFAVRDLVIWFSAGGVLVSAFLGAINYMIDGNFWFYWPSILFARAMHAQVNPWRANGWAWVRHAYWLGTTAAAVVASTAYFLSQAVRRRLRFGDLRTFFVLQFLAIATGMAAWQAVGSTGPSVFFYASYMIPPMSLAVGSILAGSGEDRPTYGWWIVILGSIAAFALSLRMANSEWVVHSLRTTLGLGAACAVAAVGLICNVLFRRKWYMVVPAIAGLAVYQTGYSGFDRPSSGDGIGWRHVVEGASAIWPEDKQKHLWFWYDIRAPHGMEMNGINAVYLWGWTYVGPSFPDIEVPSRVYAGATIVMPVDSNQWIERANEVLEEKSHLRASLIQTYTVGHDAGSFKIGLFSLEASPSR